MLSPSPATVPTTATEIFGTRNHFVFTRSDLLRFLAVTAACSLILFLRRPDAFTNPQFWAEDGQIFFDEQYHHGARALFLPYVGYLHLVTRSVAAFADLFPIVHAPLIYNLFANVLGALCLAWISLPHFRHLVRSDLTRTALAFLLAAIPMSGVVFGNITNIQWLLLFWCTLVLFQPARGTTTKIALAACYAIVVLSTPMSIILFPLWLVRAWLDVDHRRFALAMAVFLLGYVVLTKLLFVSGSPPPRVYEKHPLVMVPLIFSARNVLMVLAGPHLVETALPNNYMFAGICGLLGGVLYLWMLLKLQRDRAFCALALTWVFLSFATLGLAALFREWLLHKICFTLHGERYVLLGAMFSYILLFAAAERLDTVRPRKIATWITLAVLLLSIRGAFLQTPFTDFEWPKHAKMFEENRTTGGHHPKVPINSPGWFIDAH